MAILLSEIQQETVEEFLSHDSKTFFDIAIVSFGMDARHVHLLSQIKAQAREILVGSNTAATENDRQVRQFVSQHGGTVCSIDEICQEITRRSLASKKSGTELHVFVDVSCMSRVFMGQIFATIKHEALESPIRLTVGYCLASYMPPSEVRFPLIRRVAPVHTTFSGWGASAALPIDAIVSLGYEKGKAIGAVEYLEPRNRWIFVPHSPEERFLQQVKKQNAFLIKEETTIDYEVLRPADTYHQLLSLVVGLVQESRPVLLPFGPRIFFAISLLVAMRIEKASVWHVDVENESSGGSPQTSAHSILLTCHLKNEVQSAA
jgi:hypothetical protein